MKAGSGPRSHAWEGLMSGIHFPQTWTRHRPGLFTHQISGVRAGLSPPWRKLLCWLAVWQSGTHQASEERHAATKGFKLISMFFFSKTIFRLQAFNYVILRIGWPTRRIRVSFNFLENLHLTKETFEANLIALQVL